MYSQKKKKFTYNAVVNRQFNPLSRTRDLSDAAFPDDFNELSQTSKRQKLDEDSKDAKDISRSNETDMNTKRKNENKSQGVFPVENNNKSGFSSGVTHTKTKPLGNIYNGTSKPMQNGIKHADSSKKSSKNIISLDDDEEDLMADDFDFTQAADEIDQIEIAASQMINTKKVDSTSRNIKEKIKEKDNEDSDILEELLSGSSMSLPVKAESENNFSLKIPKKKAVTNQVVPNSENYISREPLKKQNTQFNSQITKHNEMMKNKKEVDNLQLLNTYKQKMVDAEQKYLSKDGEIKILRESLRKLTEEERKYKDRIHGLEHDLKTQQSDKEAKLIAEVEKLKTQLTFKEKEVQDAIDKHKKNSIAITSSPKSRKSPKVGFYSDAFDTTDKNKKRPITPTKKNVNKTFNTKFLSKTFKNLFLDSFSRTNSHSSSFLSKSIKSSLEFEQCFTKLKLHCNHERHDEKENDIPSDFSNSLQSVLDLVHSNSFFISEFVGKINIYLEALLNLLKTENDIDTEDVESQTDSDSESGEECIECKTIYLNGLFSLKILSGVPKIIREYILNGLVKYMKRELASQTIDGKTDVIIDSTKYYLKSSKHSKHLLLKDQTNIEMEPSCKVNLKDISYTSTAHLWELIDNLIIMRSHKNIEQLIFKLHLSLQFYPLASLSEAHCAYLIENHLLSIHLNDLTADNILDVLKLLQNFIGSKLVTQLICNKSDHCPLLLIYNWLINEELLLKDAAVVLKVFQQLVSLLSSIIAHDQVLAYSCILDGDCQCCNEVIEFLITFLFDEFKCLQKEVFLVMEENIESKPNIVKKLSCFRQGISLLCLLCINEKNLSDKRSAVEWNYIHLLVGAMKMYRKIPSINDKEVLDIEDLLDMDQYIDIDVPFNDTMEADTTANNEDVIVIE